MSHVLVFLATISRKQCLCCHLFCWALARSLAFYSKSGYPASLWNASKWLVFFRTRVWNLIKKCLLRAGRRILETLWFHQSFAVPKSITTLASLCLLLKVLIPHSIISFSGQGYSCASWQHRMSTFLCNTFSRLGCWLNPNLPAFIVRSPNAETGLATGEAGYDKN